jgi:hypothetical protein
MRSCLAPVRTQNARTRTRARTDTQPGGSPVCSLATNATGSSPVCLNGSTGAATTALAAHGTRRSERRPPARQAAADGSDAGGRLAGQGRGRGVAHTLAGWRPWHVAVEEVQEALGGGSAHAHRHPGPRKYKKRTPQTSWPPRIGLGSSDAEPRLRKAASQPMSGMPGAGRRGALAASQCGEQMACTDMSPHGNSNPHFL